MPAMAQQAPQNAPNPSTPPEGCTVASAARGNPTINAYGKGENRLSFWPLVFKIQGQKHSELRRQPPTTCVSPRRDVVVGQIANVVSGRNWYRCPAPRQCRPPSPPARKGRSRCREARFHVLAFCVDFDDVIMVSFVSGSRARGIPASTRCGATRPPPANLLELTGNLCRRCRNTSACRAICDGCQKLRGTGSFRKVGWPGSGMGLASDASVAPLCDSANPFAEATPSFVCDYEIPARATPAARLQCSLGFAARHGEGGQQGHPATRLGGDRFLRCSRPHLPLSEFPMWPKYCGTGDINVRSSSCARTAEVGRLIRGSRLPVKCTAIDPAGERRSQYRHVSLNRPHRSKRGTRCGAVRWLILEFR